MDKKIKEPKTYWDTFTGAYQMGPQKHRVYLLDLLKSLKVESILDSGCGTGPIYEMIKYDPRWDFIYKGTDYSFSMIDVCREMFPDGEFEVQDARKLLEPDNSFDCVLLLHCLDHVDDYRAVIRESARVAKKYVCVVLWRAFVAEGTNLNDKNMMGKKPHEQPWEDTHLQEYSREVLEEEFKKNNLIIEREVSGEAINSHKSSYNYLYLLEKKI